jgi:phosphatidylserine synthase
MLWVIFLTIIAYLGVLTIENIKVFSLEKIDITIPVSIFILFLVIKIHIQIMYEWRSDKRKVLFVLKQLIFKYDSAVSFFALALTRRSVIGNAKDKKIIKKSKTNALIFRGFMEKELSLAS